MAAPEFMNERPLRSRTSANGLPFSRGEPFTYFCRCDGRNSRGWRRRRLLRLGLIASFIWFTIRETERSTREDFWHSSCGELDKLAIVDWGEIFFISEKTYWKIFFDKIEEGKNRNVLYVYPTLYNLSFSQEFNVLKNK